MSGQEPQDSVKNIIDSKYDDKESECEVEYLEISRSSEEREEGGGEGHHSHPVNEYIFRNDLHLLSDVGQDINNDLVTISPEGDNMAKSSSEDSDSEPIVISYDAKNTSLSKKTENVRKPRSFEAVFDADVSLLSQNYEDEKDVLPLFGDDPNDYVYVEPELKKSPEEQQPNNESIEKAERKHRQERILKFGWLPLPEDQVEEVVSSLNSCSAKVRQYLEAVIEKRMNQRLKMFSAFTRKDYKVMREYLKDKHAGIRSTVKSRLHTISVQLPELDKFKKPLDTMSDLVEEFVDQKSFLAFISLQQSFFDNLPEDAEEGTLSIETKPPKRKRIIMLMNPTENEGQKVEREESISSGDFQSPHSKKKKASSFLEKHWAARNPVVIEDKTIKEKTPSDDDADSLELELECFQSQFSPS